MKNNRTVVNHPRAITYVRAFFAAVSITGWTKPERICVSLYDRNFLKENIPEIIEIVYRNGNVVKASMPTGMQFRYKNILYLLKDIFRYGVGYC